MCRLVVLALVAALCAGAGLAASPSSTAVSPRSGLPFAIADFDGDSRPDLASVEAGRTDFVNTEYWIELRLSAAGWQSIHLVAPVGGLRIAARDVNGDEWVDLIVTTAWSNRPVAIYLNDGHGGFAKAEASAFPSAFAEESECWLGGEFVVVDAAGLLPPSSGSACSEGPTSNHQISPQRLNFGGSSEILVGRSTSARFGRAPPLTYPHV